jgi:hypothetical protein
MTKCKNCDRDLLTQLLEPGAVGRCPWCGSMLVRNYTTLLPRLIDEVESSGGNLERALRLLTGWTGFQIKGSSVLGRLEAALRDQDVGPQDGDEASIVDAVRFNTVRQQAA